MKIETVLDYPQQTEILTAPGELVRTGESLVFLPQMEEPVARPRNWTLGFLLAATLGAIGGLIAAFVMNADSPRFRLLPPSTPQTARANASFVALAIPSIATTQVNIEVASRSRHIAVKPVVPEKSEEVSRLVTRNRRLEALVRILRKRAKPDTVIAGRN